MTGSVKRGLITFLNFQLQLVKTPIDVRLLLKIESCQECKVTKFQVGTILTCLTMDGQMHTIGKAIRPLFADPVTNESGLASSSCSNDHCFPAALPKLGLLPDRKEVEIGSPLGRSLSSA